MLADGTLVIDSDSHWTILPDFFTELAPAEYKDRMPRVEEIDGRKRWVFEGQVCGTAGPSAVIGRDGSKESADRALNHWDFHEAHVGAYDPKVRLAVLDECGIDAQVIFPSSIGLGGQDFGVAEDHAMSRFVLELYNDRMAEIQAESGNRLLSLPLMPAWDVGTCVAEAKRVSGLGARGVNMTSDPQDLGAPDLAHPAWDPFWAVCEELELPVHFHIGSSITTMGFYGSYPWPSLPMDTQLAIGGTLLFIGNARVVVNTIVSGMFDRHPGLKIVSVESGVGWIPFILDALDYEMTENAPAEVARLSKPPSEYFRSNIYATFWFENHRNRLPELIDAVGEDNILFETDFPHPTCLYPDPLGTVEEKMATLTPAARRKIYGENARRLYRL